MNGHEMKGRGRGMTRILVVDDNDRVRDSLCGLINTASKRFSAQGAERASEALERLAEGDFDVVLCDLVLQGERDGAALTRAIVEHYPEVRVVVFSGYASGERKVQVLDAGAFAYLSKPIDHDELLHAISTIAKIRHNEWLGRCFQTLARISFELQTSFDLGWLAQRIVLGARTLGYARARLYLFDAERQLLAGKAAVGLDDGFDFERFEIGLPARSMINAMFQTNRPTVWNRARLIEHFGDGVTERWLTELELEQVSWVDLPLVVGQERIGTLAVDHGAPGEDVYTESDLEILGVLAGLAGQALHNAQTYEKEALANASLRKASRQYRDLLEGFGYGTLLVTPKGTVRFANRKAEYLLQQPAGQVLGRKLSSLVLTSQRAELEKRLAEIAAGGEETSLDLSLLRPNDGAGEQRLAVRARLSPVGSAGAPSGVAVALSDKSELGALIQSGRLMALGQMVAGVAHEINNPLNNMVVAARETERRLERAGALEPKLAEYLAMVERNGERIGALVRQLREFARPGEFRQTPLQLSNVVRDAAAFFETRFRNRAVDFTLDLAPDLPAILGDATRLQQVFVNLLVNAEDAMENQSEPKKVTIATRLAAPDRVQVTVDDTGCGIPEEILEAIFDPFFTTKPPNQGTGLGLSISKSIVDMHGGRLWAEPNPAGRGARFVVEFNIGQSSTHSLSEESGS